MPHMPNGLRQRLIDAFDGTGTGSDVEWWQNFSTTAEALDLCGKLWNCSDVVPASTREQASDWLVYRGAHLFEKAKEIRQGCTFAQFVRTLKPEFEELAQKIREERNSIDEAFARQSDGRISEWWHHFETQEKARRAVIAVATDGELVFNHATRFGAYSWLEWRHPHADSETFDDLTDDMPSYATVGRYLGEALADLPRQDRLDAIGNDKPLPVEVTVSELLARDTFPNRTYHKRCFEKAWGYLTEHEDATGVLLVHGTYHGGYPHAWVELSGGVVFDGNLQRFFDQTSYYEVFNVRKLAQYNYGEALGMLRLHDHTGPWHEEA